MWSPDQYHRYSDQRSRPFFDLLAQVTLTSPRFIADLGCGSGELTATLAERWPGARIYGVDNSPEMIAEAASHAILDCLSFETRDLATWEPPEPLDLLVSNAALQWVPGHDTLLPHLVEMIAPSGVLAFQVPGNFEAPSHMILAELRTSRRWMEKLGEGAVRKPAVWTPTSYFECLTELGMKVDAWETTYLHLLQGDDAVLEWVKGTALRPVLAALAEDEQREFLGEYREQLRMAYPQRGFGTLFPFRRIFVVAEKAG